MFWYSKIRIKFKQEKNQPPATIRNIARLNNRQSIFNRTISNEKKSCASKDSFKPDLNPKFIYQVGPNNSIPPIRTFQKSNQHSISSSNLNEQRTQTKSSICNQPLHSTTNPKDKNSFAVPVQDKFESENLHLKNEIDKLNEQNIRLKNEISQFNCETIKLKSEIAQLKSKLGNSTPKEQLKTLKLSNIKIAFEKKSLENRFKIAVAKFNNDRTNLQLENKKLQLALKNSNSNSHFLSKNSTL